MTKLSVVLLATTLFCSCNQLKYLDAFEGYNGKPKIVEVETYDVIDNGTQSKEELSSLDIFYFDDEGRMTNWLDFYGPEKKPASNGWKYEYDKKGNIIKFYMINLENEVLSPILYEYDKKGQLILEKRRGAIKKTHYNKAEKTAILIASKVDGTFLDKAKTKYDSKGRQTEMSSFDSSNNLTSKYIFIYDSEEASKTTERYNSENRLVTIGKSYMDTHGNPTRSEAYKVAGNDTILTGKTDYINKYDRLNNLIEQKVIMNGVPSYVEKTTLHY